MKKIKFISVLLILSVLFSMPIVFAHNVELAGDDMIVIPDLISKTTEIKVNESFGEYNMYYQWVSMDDEAYESYLAFIESQKLVPVPGVNATAQEIQEYENTMEGYENSKNALKPVYVEEDWKETSNGTVPFNKSIEGVNEEDPYVLWIKVASKKDAANIIYEERVILYDAELALTEEEKEAEKEEEKNAETSDNILIIGILTVATVGLMAISYKKSKA